MFGHASTSNPLEAPMTLLISLQNQGWALIPW